MIVMRDWSEKLGYGKSDGTDRWPDGLFLPPLHPEATSCIQKQSDTISWTPNEGQVMKLCLSSLSSEALYDGDITIGISMSMFTWILAPHSLNALVSFSGS
jgi:hypothetical protein